MVKIKLKSSEYSEQRKRPFLLPFLSSLNPIEKKIYINYKPGLGDEMINMHNRQLFFPGIRAASVVTIIGYIILPLLCDDAAIVSALPSLGLADMISIAAPLRFISTSQISASPWELGPLIAECQSVRVVWSVLVCANPVAQGVCFIVVKGRSS
jgi:hypothetical protein